VEELVGFHIAFGKTVPDVSLNAVANLGYAECRFHVPVVPGDTLRTRSEVIGLKENSNKETGTVYVRSTGRNQKGEIVLEYTRWVMVRKRDKNSESPEATVPKLDDRVDPAKIGAALPHLNPSAYDNALAGSPHRWGDYEVGEKIDHVDGMTLEEAEHAMATRLYQNTAKVHFNQHTESKGRFGKRIVYGGVCISLARALSFNGLGNAFHLAAINGGRHVSPLFAGDTVYAWSEILEKAELPGRTDVGALRTRLVAVKNRDCSDFPLKNEKGEYAEGVMLDLDVWLVVPR
jgi:2-methylfumaryl-CoA hydratase